MNKLMRLLGKLSVLLFLLHTSPALAEGGNPVLSYIEKINGAFYWKLWHADRRSSSTLLVARSEPQHIFWHPSSQSVYYTLGRRIYRLQLDRTTPKAIGSLPAGDGEVRQIWLEPLSANLRAAAMAPVRKKEVVEERGRTHYRLKGGQPVPADDLPEWGLPYVATALELQPDGWKVIARRATKDAAGDTPGISVLDGFRHEDGFSNTRLFDSYSCISGVCRTEVPQSLIERLPHNGAAAIDRDSISMVSDAAGRPAAIFGLVQGDTLHMTTPFFLVTQQGKVSSVDIGNRPQIGLGVNGSLLLLADEGTGAAPLVLDLRNGRVVFRSNGFHATWVPIRSNRRDKSRQ